MSAVKVPTIFTAIDKMTAPMRAMGSSMSGFAAKTEVAAARSQRALTAVNGRVNALQSAVFNLRNAMAVGFLVVGAKKMFDFAANTAKAGDEIAKTSRLIGISAEALQEYRFAADRQGVSNETLTKSLQILNRSIGDVQLGQGTLTTILNRSNPALLNQLKSVEDNAEAFDMIVDAISKLPNKLQQTAFAQAAFGRSGVDMLKLLEAGPEGMAKLREEARKYGGIMSSEAAVASEKFVDAQTNMNFAMRGLSMTLGTELMPTVQGYIENLTTWVVANRELISSKVEVFVDRVTAAVGYLYNNGERILRITKYLVIGFVAVKTALLAWQVAIILVKGSLFAYRAAVIAAQAAQVGLMIAMSPLMPFILGAVAAVGLLISAISSLIRNWKRVGNAFRSGGIIGGIRAIGAALLDVVLLPIQKILETVSKIIPKRLGGGAIGRAADSLHAFRQDIGAASPTVNTKKDEQDANRSIIMETIRQNSLDVNFGNIPDNVDIRDQNGVKVNMGSTYNFGM